MEDLNFLLYREQAELLFAANATNIDRKSAHMDLARSFAARISSHQLPYRTPSASGAVGFNPGRFGANRRPAARLSGRAAK